MISSVKSNICPSAMAGFFISLESFTQIGERSASMIPHLGDGVSSCFSDGICIGGNDLQAKLV